jgi:hypothetical protein
MKKTILSILVTLLSAVVLGSVVAPFIGVDANVVIGVTFFSAFALSIAFPKLSQTVNNLTYSPIQFLGPFYEEIMNEILYMNGTVSGGLVRFIDSLNTETVITESNITGAEQAYVETPAGTESSGSLTFADKISRPFQFMIYERFSPNSFRFTRFAKPNGSDTAFPKVTDEFARFVLDRFGKLESQKMEARFWNGATAATAVAAAALTPGTGQNAIGAAEQTYIAAAPVTLIDGILTKLIMSFSVTKRRIKVAGTPLTSSNIATEVAKVYAAILPQLLQPAYSEEITMFMPHNCKQLINAFNLAATYRDLFTVDNGKYYYGGVKIEFVPLPNNAIICGKKSDLIWACDITDATANLKIDFIANDSEQMFIKGPYTQESAFVQAQQFVVYVG